MKDKIYQKNKIIHHSFWHC